ncbi:efflux RND transporter permease subunit [Bacteroides helcogenes]|uniref:Acriflavin resistance protein n=1 Tax=Bacteroides helcogenes (strain ATCC 35417 / DSM 20613 / JCM 6297 / CCUG 15421 / P 36-108) TaxID=693979 RepID=E6SUJ8_BACT6|nr:efflux RND transporter permease subunit [Bacteroides helcogenes]ADV43362.1 acriflavin resistance protein [Bacteroides helcogenes P 36-108]MDY5238130.1 efflux RND transporter permease subunit [Bacteroides helcogenes]
MKSASSFTVIVTFVCLALVGMALIPLLPVKLNPSRSLPGFTVVFRMPGTSSRVVEMEVTSKLESMLARIRGVKKLNSTSGNGFGNITVELDKHADVDAVRFEASTVVRQTWAQLPDGVSYPVIRMKVPDENASRPFMSFTLNAPSTPILIQQYAEEYIKPRLACLPGIYKIELSGATPMEWRLEYDSEQLRLLGVTLSDIQAAVQRHYRKEFLGTHNVDTGKGGEQWIRLALVPEADNGSFDPSAIPVTAADGKVLYLDELVTVTRVEEEPQGYYRINGLNSIYLSITAEETANQLKLSREVMDEMKNIEEVLPAGYEVHTSYDATEYIREELDKIYFRTGLTVLILLAFVWLITRKLKYLFLIVTSLAVNIAVALIFYYFFGLEMQLYSLAGITVSLNLVIDSTIVMTDHILHRRNLKAFMSVLAATLTTMGALAIIFFLDEKIRLNLQDFAAVVIINLAVSLMVALFFVPAMIEKVGLAKRTVRKTRKKRGFTLFGRARAFRTGLNRFVRRFPVYFTRFYSLLIRFLCRWRWAVCLLLLFGFGLPVFLLPQKLEGEGKWEAFYNKIFGSPVYKESVKPVVDKALGGSLRLFVQKVYEGSYFTRNEEVVLSAYANLPNGSTLEQMNTLIKRMEAYLSEFKEIKQFHASIYSPRRASINVYFKKEYQYSGFPYTLKANMISKALVLGGGSWGIYGLQDQGFSNDVRENAGSYRIKMYGYNYDELYEWAEKLKAQLLTHRRIKEVLINSEFSWWKDDYQEFYFNLDKERMAQEDVDARVLFAAVQPIFGKNMEVGSVLTGEGTEKIKLSSRQSQDYDVWAMQFFPYGVDADKHYKLSELAAVEKGQMPQEVAKESQQYRLCLQYEYIGSNEMGRKIQKRDLEEFSKMLPMGYTVESDNDAWGWNKKDNKQYLLLLVVIAIIFFTTSILFNSLRQPLAIIFVIPVSYIGVFLTFYWFHLNFDQGGFASFVLLCGITVNASIYILNEYNSIRRRYRCLSALRAYTKAWNSKVIPIFLTVVSTILGFIPFMIGTEKEAFWFPLAAGTIGGLVMSVIGIFFFLPVFVLKKKDLR